MTGQAGHELVPARRRIQLIGDQAVLHHSGGHGFQVVKRQFGQAVLRCQHLALLGDFDAPLECSTRLGQDGLIGRSAASAHGSASSMEQPQRNAMAAGQLLQSHLGLVNLPVAGQEARVFVAVRVPQHELLERLTLPPDEGKQLPVEG